MGLLLFFLLLPLVFAGGPLTQEENDEIQTICGTKFAAAPSPQFRRFRSMNTPNASREEGPWTVAIRLVSKTYDGRDNSSGFCTGSLISSRHVVTAAHCVAPRQKCVTNPQLYPLKRFGIMTTTHCNTTVEDNVFTCDSTLEKGYVRIKKAFFSKDHLSCGSAKRHGDVAVLELEKDLPFNKKIWPVCLSNTLPRDGDNLTLFGYGANDDFKRTGGGILRRLETTVVGYDECSKRQRVKIDEICSRHYKAIACGGDSGSGEVLMVGGKASLVSVLSYGPSCHPGLTSEEIMDYSSGVLIHNRWISAVTGVNPGYSVSQDEKVHLRQEYFEYDVLTDKGDE